MVEAFGVSHQIEFSLLEQEAVESQSGRTKVQDDDVTVPDWRLNKRKHRRRSTRSSSHSSHNALTDVTGVYKGNTKHLNSVIVKPNGCHNTAWGEELYSVDGYQENSSGNVDTASPIINLQNRFSTLHMDEEQVMETQTVDVEVVPEAQSLRPSWVDMVRASLAGIVADGDAQSSVGNASPMPADAVQIEAMNLEAKIESWEDVTDSECDEEVEVVLESGFNEVPISPSSPTGCTSLEELRRF